MKKNNKKNKTGKKITSKQVVAIIGILLLVLMYIMTLIAAIADSSVSGRLFWSCLYATIAIPILIWVYTWMYGKLTGKHTIADFDMFQDNTVSAPEGTAETDSSDHAGPEEPEGCEAASESPQNK